MVATKNVTTTLAGDGDESSGGAYRGAAFHLGRHAVSRPRGYNRGGFALPERRRPAAIGGNPDRRDRPLTKRYLLSPDLERFASAMVDRAMVEWANAPPARISAATQMASITSSGRAPARSAALV